MSTETKDVIFETTFYEVSLLEKPIPVEQNGVTLHFNYAITNKRTNRVESYSQFEPSALEQADALTEALSEFEIRMENIAIGAAENITPII